MSDESIRYQLVRQFKDYDHFGSQTRWRPYLMFGHQKNYRSESVNTDKHGLRQNRAIDGEIRDFESCVEAGCHSNILLGGSTAFGVGASTDNETVSSVLTKLSGQQWLNFGGRAFSGTQEFLQFQMYGADLDKIDNFVHFSGLNDLFLYFWSKEIDEDFGPFYFSDYYSQAMNQAGISEPSFKQLREYFFRKLKRRLGLQKKTSQKQEFIKSLPEQRERRCDLALQMVESNLSRAVKMTNIWGARHTYVLQPIAPWIDKKPSGEEAKLFKANDELSPETAECISIALSQENYLQYRNGLKDICQRLGVDFLDLNRFFSETSEGGDWLFVDRVHLTDKGYDLAASWLYEELPQ